MASPNYLSFHHNVTIPLLLVSTSTFISVVELFLKYFLMILCFFFKEIVFLDVFLDSFNNSVYFFFSLLWVSGPAWAYLD